MSEYAVEENKYAALARQTVAEGCVLLKNDNEVLPIRAGEKIAVFGEGHLIIIKADLVQVDL